MRHRKFQRRAGGEHGMALMVVIWIVGMLALQVALFNGSVRDAVRLAENAAALTRGDALTRAAVELVAARLLARDPRERWQPDGRAVAFAYGGATLRVRITDERSRINLNHADEALLKGLFRVVTGSSLEAGRFTARLLAWRRFDTRRPGARASSVAANSSQATGASPANPQPLDRKLLDPTDIGRALDASPDLVRRLLPFVTIYGPDSKINPSVATETVLRALPDLTPQNLEIALAIRRRSNDPAQLEAALATTRERLVAKAGTIVRLEIEVDGSIPLVIGGAEVIIATGVDTAAPYRILVWRLRDYNGMIAAGARTIMPNEPVGDPEKVKDQ